MLRPGVIIAVLMQLASISGCDDDCESLSPSFQLDILSATGAGSLQVMVQLGEETRAQAINLEGALDDGETSLVVELDPSITTAFELDISVDAHSEIDGTGAIVGTAGQHFSGTPDGCNRFELSLGPPPDGCNQTCTDTECDFGCAGGCGTCELDCRGAENCQTSCSGSSVCNIDCRDTTECKIRCQGNASCRMDCSGSGDCAFTTCSSTMEMCGDGSMVCGRACPQ